MNQMKTIKFPNNDEIFEVVDATARESISQLSDEASAIKSDLSNLSDVTAESVETTVEVEAEIEYSEENTDCRFTLNSDYTKVATSTSALANYTL